MGYIGIVLGIFLLDFFIKRYVDKTYVLKEKHCRFHNRFYIQKYYNDGAMLNFLEDRPKMLKVMQTFFLVALSIGFYMILRKDSVKMEKIGISFLMGGGFSNLYDRYQKGHVVDYIGFCFGPKWFQRIIFNVSDFFIFIGVVLAIIGHEQA